MITNRLKLLIGLLAMISYISLEAHSDTIIPKPQKTIARVGEFYLSRDTTIKTDTRLSKNAIDYLQSHLATVSGYRLVSSQNSATISYHYDPKLIKKAEAYILDISPKHITIEARDSGGFFYATISLMQLMDSDIWSSKRSGQKIWSISCCKIEDYPRFAWRGMLLDSSRNFFTISYIKKFIDRMSQYKLNRFHWHLTDDEGWRLEIKRYPLLTKIGAVRGDGTKLPYSTYPAIRGKKSGKYRGYYTQQQIRDIVSYAKARSIEILPEIDIPAHSKAAVVSYPDLLLDPRDKSNFKSIQRVSNNTINPAMKSSYKFIDGVISEVTSLFPFEYIHIGGDEVPKGAWSSSPAVKILMKREHLKDKRAVEDYFFAKVDKVLQKYNRRVIGWQEIVDGKPKMRKSSIIMAWKSPKSADKIISKGYNTILSPVQYLYFDQRYTKSRGEYGHTWSTPISLKKVYSYRPKNSRYIKGIQANLWSETLLNEHIADYLAWPRTLALSEVAWSDPKSRNWSEFKKRLYSSGVERLKIERIDYRR